MTLVGAPNVGKSSLVRLFSSGRPEVQNYPFTTRGIQMGHILVEDKRFVFTDTPGVLPRPDGARLRRGRPPLLLPPPLQVPSPRAGAPDGPPTAPLLCPARVPHPTAGLRNRMERLTLATLAYLPVNVIFVTDLSGGCGTRVRAPPAPRTSGWPPCTRRRGHGSREQTRLSPSHRAGC